MILKLFVQCANLKYLGNIHCNSTILILKRFQYLKFNAFILFYDTRGKTKFGRILSILKPRKFYNISKKNPGTLSAASQFSF
jgi:hypothetical protein